MARSAGFHDWIAGEVADPALAAALLALAGAGRSLSDRIALGPLDERHGARTGAANADGDVQAALDVIADETCHAALTGTGIRHYLSEERPEVATLDPAGSLAIAIDPLDGSSNIDTDISIGTIFGIWPAAAEASASFLRPGTELLASGYIIYGPQTQFVLTLGRGIARFVLDRAAGSFHLVETGRTIPEAAPEFAINASNYRHWPRPVRAYIDDCVAGEEGPRGRNFNMRWIASLVAETHRIIMRGGIFLYPADSRKGYEKGRLRHLYECAPIAFLVEQAGGAATDGCDRILTKRPEGLHARTPFVFGSAGKVARVAAYHDLPEAEVAPLFGKRGLFTA